MMTKYYRTVYTVEVLSAIPPNDMDDLDQIAYDIREGDASGKVERSSFEEVSAERMRELLIAQGSDPGFLSPDEDEPRIPCHFEVTDELDDVEYGNVVADNGGDVLDENITRAQYTEQHPDNLY